MKFDIKEIQAQILAKGGKIFARHAIISIILILGVLMYTVYTISTLIDQKSDEIYRAEKQAEITQANFDDDTIQKINKLSQDSDSGLPSLPSGRINPFIE